MKRALVRMAVLVLAAVLIAAIVNTVRPRGLRWIAAYAEVYPPPPPATDLVTKDEVAAAIDAGVPIIDARTAEKYRQGHIPFAHNLPSHEAPERLAEVFQWAPRTEDLIIVYCGGVECDDSVPVRNLLIESGFTNVKLYLGGWQEWTGANMPVEVPAEP